MSTQKKQAKSKLKKLDIAERMVPEFHKDAAIYGEHFIRYEAARKVVKGKITLDIASGSGYGTKLLASQAKKVYGVDISQDAVDYANANFSARNIEYKVGDGQKIPLKDNSVDVVVSFETIEHVKDYEKFMDEVGRVLKEDGLLLLSTPNELEFTEGNHYHLHEFEEKELKKLANSKFKNVDSYYQGNWVYSALLTKEQISKESLNLDVRTLNLAPLEPRKYLYFYLLCSNRVITERIESIGALSEHWSARTIDEHRKKTIDYIQNVNDVLDSTRKHAKDLEKILGQKEELILGLQEELDKFHSRLGPRVVRKVKSIRKVKRG